MKIDSNECELKKDVDDEDPSSYSPPKVQSSFIRIPIAITFTAIVLILLIAGTAATAISFPPKPPPFSSAGYETEIETALDGNKKLIGPLLLTSGIFLLIITSILCAIVTRDAYIASRTIHPPKTDVFPKTEPISLLGGPIYLATSNSSLLNSNGTVPFALSRQLWAMPNAPTSDIISGIQTEKFFKPRAMTASSLRSTLPAYDSCQPNDS